MQASWWPPCVLSPLHTLFQDKLGEVMSTYETTCRRSWCPLPTELHERLTKDSEKLKEEIRKRRFWRSCGPGYCPTPPSEQKIGDNVASCSSAWDHTQGLRSQVDTQAQQLRRQLTPYAQRMER